MLCAGAVTHEDVDRLIAEHGPEIVSAALRPLLTDERMARVEAVLDARLDSLTFAIENLHDPHNGAAAIRTAEAVGLTSLHVAETAEEFSYSPAITIGCEKWIQVVHHRTIAGCAGALREAGFRLYATCPGARWDLESVPVDSPVALLIGNEREGLTAEAVAACDQAVSIPMHGFTQSFNLSVSVALSIHRLAQRRRTVLGRAGDLGDQKRAHLRARWYAMGIRGAEAIVSRYTVGNSGPGNR